MSNMTRGEHRAFLSAIGVVFALVVAAFIIAGCAFMPATPSADPVADLQAQNIAARKTCIELLDRDRLSVAGGTRCLLVTNQVSDAIAVARAAGGGSIDLESSKALLLELEKQLQTEGAL